MISVGNITCGGTGKTPTVEMVARDLLEMGRRPAILSRGYGIPARARASGGGEGERSPRGNDEFEVLVSNLPDIPHYQGRDRHACGLEALVAGADTVLLDDGFQHTRLRRDLDLVLIDAILPFGHGRVLPAGLLREPVGALAHADLFAITRSDQVSPLCLSTIETYLRNRFPGVPRILLKTEVVECRSLGGEPHEARDLGGRRVLAFCGIGNPESFRRQLLGLGAVVEELICFRDHHAYSASDLERLERLAAARGVERVVLTQKDAVKIPRRGGALDWVYLRISQRIVRGEEEYRDALKRAIRRQGQGG